jgi:ZIP family zinc transporter
VLTLAAGSGVAGRTKRVDWVAYGLLIGLLAGFLTDAMVTAAASEPTAGR